MIFLNTLEMTAVKPDARDHDREELVSIYEESRQRAAPFEVVPPEQVWTGGVEFDAIFPRECYKQALLYSIGSTRTGKGHQLVHGETSLALGGHAWVEIPGGFVFDGVFQRFYRRDDYYSDMAHATPWYVYDEAAVHLLSVHFRHDPGSWWSLLELPMIFNRPPIHISFEYARELLAKHYVRSGEQVLKRLSKDVLASFAEILGIEFERGQKKADLVRLLMQSRENGK